MTGSSPARYRRSAPTQDGTAATGSPSVPVSDLAEDLARDVRVLMHTGSLPLTSPAPPKVGDTPADAERLANWARRQIRAGQDPISDPQAAVASLGLLLFLVPDSDTSAEAAYLRLEEEGVGVAWVADGPWEKTSRRRFSAAHELGHHLRVEDDYRAENDDDAPGEAFANAFAISFLLPRAGAQRVFDRHSADPDRRPAVLETATTYGVSWSAACVQLRNLQLLTDAEHSQIANCTPDHAEFSAQTVIAPGMPARRVPGQVTDAAVSAYRRRKITAAKCRAIAQDPSFTLPELDALPAAARERFIRPAWLDAL